jgi:hypothetical protein
MRESLCWDGNGLHKGSGLLGDFGLLLRDLAKDSGLQLVLLVAWIPGWAKSWRAVKVAQLNFAGTRGRITPEEMSTITCWFSTVTFTILRTWVFSC